MSLLFTHFELPGLIKTWRTVNCFICAPYVSHFIFVIKCYHLMTSIPWFGQTIRKQISGYLSYFYCREITFQPIEIPYNIYRYNSCIPFCSFAGIWFVTGFGSTAWWLCAPISLVHRDRGKYHDNNVNGANMGPIWGRQDPGGSNVGPMNLAIWVEYVRHIYGFM